MCCFSRPVKEVSGTSIFARSSDQGRQYLVYSMKIEAGEDLAMILPIPTKPDADEKSISFISLKEYPTFFKDMKKGFPEESVKESKSRFDGRVTTGSAKIVVHDVGEFEASFVPTVKDFSRLDERFRLPDGTWDKLPEYSKYGFAVFKLKKGAKTVHPMAFEFERRTTKSLFFPTVHIHDGKVHARADFDHALYCQQMEGELESLSLLGWRESPQPAGMFMDEKKSLKIILPNAHAYQLEIRGEKKNEDIWVQVA